MLAVGRRLLLASRTRCRTPGSVSPLPPQEGWSMAVTSIAPVADATLDAHELARMDAYWRAANYLSVGQIYLLDNPLLREPLRARARQAAAARPLGHDARAELHLRPPQPRDPAARPRHDLRHRARARRPGLVANTYLEGTYSEIYPDVTRGRGRACGGCSGSSRSPAASRATSRPRRPGSIHEGGELGYALVARLRRGVRQPRPGRRLRGRRRRGRDRAAGREPGTPTSSSTRRATARCCRSCTSTATRSPTRRCWRASPDEELDELLRGYGYEPLLRRGRRARRRCTS